MVQLQDKSFEVGIPYTAMSTTNLPYFFFFFFFFSFLCLFQVRLCLVQVKLAPHSQERGLVRAPQGLSPLKGAKIRRRKNENQNQGVGGGYLCSKSKTRNFPALTVNVIEFKWAMTYFPFPTKVTPPTLQHYQFQRLQYKVNKFKHSWTGEIRKFGNYGQNLLNGFFSILHSVIAKLAVEITW